MNMLFDIFGSHSLRIVQVDLWHNVQQLVLLLRARTTWFIVTLVVVCVKLRCSPFDHIHSPWHSTSSTTQRFVGRLIVLYKLPLM